MASSTIGSLVINIEMGLAQLKKDVADAKNVVQTNLEAMSKAASLAKIALEALAASYAVDKLREFVSASFDAIDANAKMADRLSITTEAMAGLSLEAQLAGIQQQTLIHGMRSLQDNIYAATEGVNQQSRALKQLGLTTEQLFALRPDQQLEKVLNALSKVENVTQRNALAAQLFSGRATEMLNIINDGSDAIRKATTDAEAWGLALNRVDSAKVELANDAVTRAEGALRGIANTTAVMLSPIIRGVANELADAAKDAHGFRDEILASFETVAKVVGFVGDAFHYAHIVADMLMLLVHEVANAFVQVAGDIASAIDKIVGVAARLHVISKDTADSIHGFLAPIKDAADQDAVAMDKLRQGFADLTMQDAPSAKIVAWFERVKTESQKAAEDVAKNREKMLQPSGPVSTHDYDKDLQTYQQALLKRVWATRNSMRDQRQVEQEAYEQQRADLLAAMQQGLLDQTAGNAELEQLEYDHQARLWGLKQAFHQLDLQSTDYFLGQIAQLMQSHSRAAFEVGKVASIAQTIIKTYEAAQSAYAAMAGIPLIGPALGAAAAIAAITFGLAQVDKIKSTSFGSTSASASGSVAAVPTIASNPSTQLPVGTPGGNVGPTQAAQAPQVVNIYLPGDGAPLSQDWIRNKLVPAINDAQADGAAIIQVY